MQFCVGQGVSGREGLVYSNKEIRSVIMVRVRAIRVSISVRETGNLARNLGLLLCVLKCQGTQCIDSRLC